MRYFSPAKKVLHCLANFLPCHSLNRDVALFLQTRMTSLFLQGFDLVISCSMNTIIWIQICLPLCPYSTPLHELLDCNPLLKENNDMSRCKAGSEIVFLYFWFCYVVSSTWQLTAVWLVKRKKLHLKVDQEVRKALNMLALVIGIPCRSASLSFSLSFILSLSLSLSYFHSFFMASCHRFGPQYCDRGATSLGSGLKARTPNLH